MSAAKLHDPEHESPAEEFPPETASLHSWSSIRYIHAPSSRLLFGLMASIGVSSAFLMLASALIQTSGFLSTPGRIVFEGKDAVKVEFHVPAKQVIKFLPGAEVLYRVDAYPEGGAGHFTGSITSVGRKPANELLGNDYLVTASIESENKLSLLSGMEVEAKVITRRETLLNTFMGLLFHQNN